jgi:hypothetical protein
MTFKPAAISKGNNETMPGFFTLAGDKGFPA